VLAVKVDYPSKKATIGSKPGKPVSREEILKSLKKIGYSGTFTEE
jgi:hypothetical protein